MTTPRFASASILAFVCACWIATVWAGEPSPDTTVLFVCEHGSVKSLMAARLFEKAAMERGLSARGISRGMTPDAHVPTRIVDGLKLDGIDVAAFEPMRVDQGEVRAASRVVVIGVDPAAMGTANRPVEAWNDIPESSDYPAARAALLRHIGTLLDELQSVPAKDKK